MEFLCKCMGKIIVKAKMPNGQFNIQCENYEYGCCKGSGFIFGNSFFYSIELWLKVVDGKTLGDSGDVLTTDKDGLPIWAKVKEEPLKIGFDKR